MFGETDIGEALAQALSRFELKNILGTAVILLVCVLINKLILRILNKVLRKTSLQAKVIDTILSIVKGILWVVAGLVAAAELGFNTSSLVALVSIFSLGITLAAEDILSNVAGGLVMLSTKPFRIGDYIKTDEVEGSVVETHVNFTKLKTVDGVLITVPNKHISTSKVYNYTMNGKRRLSITVGTEYDVPTDKVITALTELMKSYDTVLPDPEPFVYLTDYESSNIMYTMYCWVKTSDWLKTKWNMTQDVRAAFAKYGIQMSYNHVNVHMIGDGAKTEPVSEGVPVILSERIPGTEPAGNLRTEPAGNTGRDPQGTP